MNGSASAFAKRAGVGIATAAATAVGLRLLGLDPWSLHDLSVPSFVSFLFVAGVAGLCVSFDVVRPSADSNGSMRLAFVASMTALLLRGPFASILVAGIGALAIPGLGPFIAAGPIMAALSGGAIGAGVGGIAGALIGLGIPEYEAKRYEGKVKEGGILISAHCDDSEKVTQAKAIYKDAGAQDITSTGEATADLRKAS